jgi:5-methylcytosine-specific restriction endonuclease McrA
MRTCTVDGCDKAHRARGLCATHYNQQHQPNRHPKVELTCAACGSSITKDKGRERRYTNVFCDKWCMGIYYMEHGQADALVQRNKLNPPRLGSGKPKPATFPSSRLFTFDCRSCAAPTCSQSGTSRYCSNTCRNRVRKVARKGRQSIRREAIFIRDDYMCWMCETPCDRAAQVPEHSAPTVDHIIPRSLGGGDEPENLATACFMCNTLRGASWEIPTRTHVR